MQIKCYRIIVPTLAFCTNLFETGFTNTFERSPMVDTFLITPTIVSAALVHVWVKQEEISLVGSLEQASLPVYNIPPISYKNISNLSITACCNFMRCSISILFWVIVAKWLHLLFLKGEEKVKVSGSTFGFILFRFLLV